jgi:hypothetical protein
MGLGKLLIYMTCAGAVLANTAANADAKPGYFVLTPSVYDTSGSRAPTWTGSLQAHLPGADPLTLTGAGFVTALCQRTTFEAVARCLRPVKGEAAGTAATTAR